MQRVEQAFYQLNQLQINETPNSPTPWDEIVTALSQLRTYMKDIADSPDPKMAHCLLRENVCKALKQIPSYV